MFTQRILKIPHFLYPPIMHHVFVLDAMTLCIIFLHKLDRLSSNCITVVLSGSSIENFDSQKPKDRNVAVFVNTSAKVRCAPWDKCLTVCLITTEYKEYVCLSTRYGLHIETEIEMW